MTIYQTADGKLWTLNALSAHYWKGLEEGWDEATQGEFPVTAPLFRDWLIEAINTGVVKELELND